MWCQVAQGHDRCPTTRRARRGQHQEAAMTTSTQHPLTQGPTQMRTHTVRGAGDVRLHVREWGPHGGTPIVLIHGISQSHQCWTRQYDSALVDEFRLVAYDLRGHGMSEAPDDAASYTDGRTWADDLAAVID